jgi:hypothetical protein
LLRELTGDKASTLTTSSLARSNPISVARKDHGVDEREDRDHAAEPAGERQQRGGRQPGTALRLA